MAGKGGSKAFFFEKKKQKTFVCFGFGFSGEASPCDPQAFLVLFLVSGRKVGVASQRPYSGRPAVLFEHRSAEKRRRMTDHGDFTAAPKKGPLSLLLAALDCPSSEYPGGYKADQCLRAMQNLAGASLSRLVYTPSHV